MSARIGVWTIRLMRSEDFTDETKIEEWDKVNQEVHNEFLSHLDGAEKWLSEKVPEGFYVKIEDN